MDLKKIRGYLKYKIGSPIKVVYYGNRNKIDRYQGELINVYDNVFVIVLANGSYKCFNLIDILTKTIQIYI